MIDTGPPWAKASPQSSPEHRIHSFDITIIGGGVAACWLAFRLAQAGASVQLCVREAALLSGYAHQSLPKVTLGLTDSLSRLQHGIGIERSQLILDLGLQSRSLWTELGAFVTAGGFHIATDDKERIEIEESLQILHEHGGWQARAQESDFGVAFFSPLEGNVDITVARRAFEKSLSQAQVQIQYHCPIHTVIGQRNGSFQLESDRESYPSELVIYAEGWQAGALDPFLAAVLTPVREQWVAFPAPPRPNHRIQYGYQYWGSVEGHMLYGGCRWGSMHFEVGETEPMCNPKIHAHLSRIAKQRYPQHPSPTHAWATIMTHSCDSLPLVGALPGSGNQLCCLAFQGHDCSLAPALAVRLAQTIIDGENQALPHWLRPHRLKL